MKLNRRWLLSGAVATLAGLSTTKIAKAQGEIDEAQGDAFRERKRKTFILVHGSWHASGVWERVGHQLVAAGHSVIARDLPGHGLNATFPQSYFQRPLDAAAFSGEVSPVAGVTVDDYVGSIASSIRDAVLGGSGPVILVGHSSGGFSITAVAEKYPEYISDLVYLTAIMPAAGVTANDDLLSNENNNNRAILPLFFGDPSTIGGSRLDWNSTDAAYLAALQNVFYNDVNLTTFRAVANFLTPDDPASPFVLPTVKTVQRWGSVRRSFIRCGQDHLFLPALQDRWISQADALVPSNRTAVYHLDSSHSAFISQPDNLAAVLLDIARRSS